MVEFGKTLLESRVEAWNEYYIDYHRLKSLIKEALKNRQQPDSGDITADSGDNKLDDRSQSFSTNTTSIVVNDNAVPQGHVTIWAFRRMVEHEIQKIVLFVLTREGQLAERLYKLSKDGQTLKAKVLSLVQDSRRQELHLQQMKDDATTTSTTKRNKMDAWKHLEVSIDQHREFARDVLQLVNYIDLNVTGLRKILKKHDKNFPHNQLSRFYLHHRGGNGKGERRNGRDGIDDTGIDDSHLDKLYHFGGLSALVLTLRRAFDDLHLLELHLLTVCDAATSAPEHKNDGIITSHNSSINLSENDVGTRSSRVLLSIPHEKDTKVDKQDPMVVISSPNCPTHLLSTTLTRKREPILDQINAARNRLQQTTKYAELVAGQALIFVDDNDEEGSIADEEKIPASDFNTAQKISSMLNLGSTFLYMTNYYIVAPSVGDYALRLGSDVSMSGYIIGMTPNAALIATVLYGYWSSFSYRHALIFASASSFSGNILYVLALKYKSIKMVLLGRFLIGFGSARAINRRYIADVFSKADRTAASADFVTYAALGMAAGPATAFAVGQITFDPSNLLWTDVTAPGWIMLGVWGIFLVLLVKYFEEPDRSRFHTNLSKDSPSLKTGSVISTNSIDRTNRETTPLLIKDGNEENDDEQNNVQYDKSEPPLWKNVAVMISLWLYFVLKLVLEMLLSSSGIVTKLYFDWGQSECGIFLTAIALLMFPVNMVVARLSQKYEDRELITAALIVMLISVLGMIDYVPEYSVYQYIIFSIGVFTSTNSLEGVNMALLSKTIPPRWARGIFNSGFLATEAGTLARSVGDVIISGVLGMFGLENLLNGLFEPMALLCAISLAMVYFSYSKMTDADLEDDDSNSDEQSNSK